MESNFIRTYDDVERAIERASQSEGRGDTDRDDYDRAFATARTLRKMQAILLSRLRDAHPEYGASVRDGHVTHIESENYGTGELEGIFSNAYNPTGIREGTTRPRPLRAGGERIVERPPVSVRPPSALSSEETFYPRHSRDSDSDSMITTV